MSEVGFIGVGVMGRPMARNLLRGGHRVRAFDLNPAALDAARGSGAEAAGSARQAAEGAEFVITMLPRSEHVEAALFGPEGAADALEEGALAVDMSTVLPADFDRLADRVAEAGGSLIDAPVGRTSQHAEEGKLLIMAGGGDEEVERVRPLLECMGDTIVHCGPRGAGMRTKLINNYLSVVSNVVVAEALVAAERVGLDRDTVIGVLMGTTAGQGHLGTTYPAKALAGDLTPGFMVDLARKDLGLALQMGEAAGVRLSMGEAANGAYQTAQDRGRGAQDWTAVYRALQELHGLDSGEGGAG